jgi:curved DNA-binding protein CbpA
MIDSLAMDDDAVSRWLESLDRLDYYELLQVERTASADDVRSAFHAFAETFHPDGHVGASQAARAGLEQIFRRGTEAYWVLADPKLRAAYDAGMDGAAPRIRMAFSPSSVPPAPERLEDRVHSPSARPFARRAEELVLAGDYKQAKLHIMLATSREPENDALRDYLAFIEQTIAANGR